MPQERSDMRRVKEVLRLAHELGYSNRQIQESVRMGRTSVGEYLARAREAGVRYADVAGMGEAEVEALLFKRPEPAVLRPIPDWAEVAAELRKPGVTLQLVWQEYRDRHADGYSYSQFRRRYRAHWKLDAEPRMRRTLLPAQLVRGRLRRDDHDGHRREWRTPSEHIRRHAAILHLHLRGSDLDAKRRRLARQPCADVWRLGRLGSQARAGQSENGRHPRQLLRAGAEPILSGACAPLRHRRGPSARATAEG